MNAISEIGNLLLQTLFGMAMLAFILRLLLQWARADFYNPISQFLVKVTNPLLLPARRFIPAFGRLDTASVVIAIIIQALAICSILLVLSAQLPPVLSLLYWSLLGVVATTVSVYFYAVLANIILSWIAPGTYHPAASLLQQITEPVMKPFRKLVPPIGGMDLSPIILFLCINVVQIVLRHLAVNSGLHPALVFGI